MIDINIVREKLDWVRKNLSRRKQKFPLDALVDVDTEWRLKSTELNRLRHERNEAAKKIAELKKQNLPISKETAIVKQLSNQIAELEKQLDNLDKKRYSLLLQMPNFLDDSVPVGEDSSENVTIRKWGEQPVFKFQPQSHVDILEKKGLADIERAARATGARFYYLKGDLFMLGLALTQYAINFLAKKGFIPMETPFLLKREAIQGAIALTDFEDVIYKIEDEDLYLIATAEHTLLAYHMGEIFMPDELPKCYAGYSTNFRKEAGAHGKDTKGIFRVHQFDKVEQFVFCKPEDSWYWHEKLIENAEQMYQELEIPYRIVNVCTGDMGTVAAKKYDLETWMPAQNQYREVVSCSNCTDYQARRLNIRYRTPEGNKYVHTLNSTAIAIQRTIVAILENNQLEDGCIRVPKVLQPYIGKEIIGR